MSATVCGLDFGTSNSTFGYMAADAGPRLVALEEGNTIMPSALFFNFENDQVYFGGAALNEYVTGANGRLMRALKSLLGSSLMHDRTRIKRRNVPFTEILGDYLHELLRRAKAEAGQELTSVVVGRPVHFNDDDPKIDREAQNQLESAVRALGFANVEFQFEPIAAALDYERRIEGEELAMVADIGGGTSDFTIIRLSPQRARVNDRSADLLATAGVHIGGTDFDRLLSMAEIMPLLGLNTTTRDGKRLLPIAPFYNLATWYRINRLYSRPAGNELRAIRQEAARRDVFDRFMAIVDGRYGHFLASRVEDAKISLSDVENAAFAFEVPGALLEKTITRKAMIDAIADSAERIPQTMAMALAGAGLKADDIQTVIMTGGSTRIGWIGQRLQQMFRSARFVDTDAFGSVGLGLTITAARWFAGAAA